MRVALTRRKPRLLALHVAGGVRDDTTDAKPAVLLAIVTALVWGWFSALSGIACLLVHQGCLTRQPGREGGPRTLINSVVPQEASRCSSS